MFDRTIENTIKEKINGGKAIVVVGARQVDKTEHFHPKNGLTKVEKKVKKASKKRSIAVQKR